MSVEFTTTTARPPRIGPGRNKSEVRQQIEALEVGGVLLWRPDDSTPLHQADSAAHWVRKESGFKLTVRKVDGGCDIYRTA